MTDKTLTVGLLPCPFCGSQPTQNDHGLWCCGNTTRPHCPASLGCVRIETWNRRVAHADAEDVRVPREYIKMVLDELGVPGPEYPTPVINAVEMLNALLTAHEGKEEVWAVMSPNLTHFE